MIRRGWMMDLKLLLPFVIISLLPGYGLSCQSDAEFETSCRTPYTSYQTSNFWNNICSVEGMTVFSCIVSKAECSTDDTIHSTFLNDFKERFDVYDMNIQLACEHQKKACQNITNCFNSSLYNFQGDTIYNFYEYFCGSLRDLFLCLKDYTTDCPVTVERYSVFNLNTPSGLLNYSALSNKILPECAKLQVQDLQCMESNKDEFAQCGIMSTINMTSSKTACSYTTKTKPCIFEKCGATVATFYDEMYKFFSCYVDKGEWSGWTSWSTCTLTCGQGISLRTRACSIGPIVGEQVCEGDDTEVKNCTIQGCPVDGKFGFWGYWTDCDQNCDGGTQTRTRSCNNPKPANGGADCVGNRSQSESCNEQQCQGVYSIWGSWNTCSKSCGQGSQSRTRTCEGEGSCSGASTESRDCNLQTCPVDGVYTEWAVWSVCSKTCGGGTRARTRTCTNPYPANGGKVCDGESNQSEGCNEQACQAKRCTSETDSRGTWPETIVGATATLGCKKQDEIGSYSRRCGTGGMWEEVTGKCDIDPAVLNEINEELKELANSDKDISADLENILRNLTGLTGTVNADTSAASINNLVDTTQNTVDVIEATNTVTDKGTEEFLNVIDNIISPDTEETWQKSEADGSDILGLVERYIKVVQKATCDTIATETVNEYSNKHMYTEIGKLAGGVKFPSNMATDTFLEIPEVALSKLGITDSCFSATNYKSAGNLINGGFSMQGTIKSTDSGQVVNSEIVSVTLQEKPGVTYSNLESPAVITFKPKNETLGGPVCVFWDFDATGPGGQKGAWSADGCIVKEFTEGNVVCECSHLTNFAVLMSPSGAASKHSKILSIISAVGCAISMVCLILTIVAHAVVWRLVRSDRAIILMNLCVALFVALGVFLAGINRTESRTACAAMAAIIQYLFLAVFFFMLLIGIEILICVVHVFVTKFRIKLLLPVAWLAPAIIVGITLGVTKAEGYGNDKFCWLDTGSGLIWAFIGPAAFIIFVNFIIILIVFKKMATSAVLKSKTSTIKIKTGLRSLCVLLPLMGLTWLFGIVSVNSSMFIFQYLFCILNTLQGLFIFLFHCVFNRQIRDAIKRRQERRKSLQTFSSDLRKQSRSQSKDEKQRRQSGDRRASDNKTNGIDNKSFTDKDYDPNDWDKAERKMYHKNIRRGSKFWK